MGKVFWHLTTFFASMAWISSSFAQAGNLNEVLQCALKPGFSMEEVVSVGKAIPRNENGPNLVFYRELNMTLISSSKPSTLASV